MVHVWCIGLHCPISKVHSTALTKVLVQENSKMWRLASKVSSVDRCNDNRKQDIETWNIEEFRGIQTWSIGALRH